MGLEIILKELGAEKPFDKDGNYTKEGLVAEQKLLTIVNNLEYIGALGKTNDDLENYLDEIVRLGF